MQLVSLCLVVLFNGAAVAKSLSIIAEMLNVYSIRTYANAFIYSFRALPCNQ